MQPSCAVLLTTARMKPTSSAVDVCNGGAALPGAPEAAAPPCPPSAPPQPAPPPPGTPTPLAQAAPPPPPPPAPGATPVSAWSPCGAVAVQPRPIRQHKSPTGRELITPGVPPRVRLGS